MKANNTKETTTTMKNETMISRVMRIALEKGGKGGKRYDYEALAICLMELHPELSNFEEIIPNEEVFCPACEKAVKEEWVELLEEYAEWMTIERNVIKEQIDGIEKILFPYQMRC